MQTGLSFLVLSFLFSGTLVFGDTDSHVMIIVNQNAASKAGFKTVASHKPKKIKSHKKTISHIKHKTAIAKAPVVKKPIPVQRIAEQQQIKSVQQVPGRRVSLANTEAARANGYSDDVYNGNPTQRSGVNYNLLNSGGLDSSSSAPTLTTKVKHELNKEPESFWEFQYRTSNAMNMNALENYGTGLDYTIAAWDRFYVTYNINHDLSLGIVAQYYHTWFQDQNRPQSTTNPGLTQSYASYLGDTGLVLTDKKLATLAGGVILSGQAAFYAPTSQSSQTSGMYGQSRTGLALGKSIGKVDLKWNETLWYDFQQYDTNAYLNTSNGTTVANPQDYVFSNVDITYNFTKKFSFTVETGFINESNYGDSYNGIAPVNNDYVEVNPELDYSFSKLFSLGLGIWEVYNMTNQPTINGETVSYYTPFAPYNGTAPGYWTSSQLYLMGTVTF